MNIRVALVAAAVVVCGAAASAQQPIGAELVDTETFDDWINENTHESLTAALMWYAAQQQVSLELEDHEDLAEWQLTGAREGLIAAMMWRSVLLLSSVDAPEDGEWGDVRGEDEPVLLARLIRAPARKLAELRIRGGSRGRIGENADLG